MNLKQTMSCELKQLDKDLSQINYLGIVADKLNTMTRIYCGRAKPTLDQSHFAPSWKTLQETVAKLRHI